MSAIDTNRIQGGTHAPGLISKLLAAVSGWNDIRMTRKALNGLSDRELDDIGLTRGDIDHLSAYR